jgi:hypothetical protein
MADNFLNKNMHSNFSNNPVDQLNYWKTSQDDLYYKSTLSQNRFGDFQAVILSGFVTSDNTGAGIDRNDAKIVASADSNERFIEITVFPLDYEGAAWLDIRDYDKFEDIHRVISMTGTIYRARCEHNYEDSKESKLLFGHVVTCFYEGNDPTKLRFRNVSNPTPDLTFLQLYNLAGIETAINAFRSSAGMAAFVGDYTNFNPMLPVASDSEIIAIAQLYDQDTSIPLKGNHAPHLGDIHPEFNPYIKAWIYKCWTEKKIKIQLNDGYRSPKRSNELIAAWEARGRTGPKPAAAGTSYHNAGLAIDFNPYINGQVLLSSAPKASFISSGLVAIGESLGLRWGGYFSTNYDPIHFDFGKKVSKTRRAELIKEAANRNIEVTRIPTGRA